MIYDISPPLTSRIAVWPGDVPFRLDQSLSQSEGANYDLSSIQLSLHTGSHMDAPLHYLPEGASIDAVDIGRCIGPARVVNLAGHAEVLPEHLEEAISESSGRILMKTMPDRDPDEFPEVFPFLSEGAARLLVERGVVLVGTESPSMDHFRSSALPAHRTLGRAGVLILENLVLGQVPEGIYELIALPLKIVGGEASPVRAVLRDIA
jgi:arylformamidase